MIFFTIYKKMSEKTYCRRNRDVILNRAKNFYEHNKEYIKTASKR